MIIYLVVTLKPLPLIASIVIGTHTQHKNKGKVKENGLESARCKYLQTLLSSKEKWMEEANR